MKDNLSPEEKLLKLIKGEKKTGPAGTLRPAIETKQPLSALAQAKPQFNTPHSFSAFRYFNINKIQKLLIILIAASFIYLAASFIYPFVGLNRMKMPDISQEKNAAQKIEPKEQIRPYESFQEAVKNRQIFAQPQTSGAGLPAVNVLTQDLIKDINLVGIIAGENPQAVIEDKKTQKTFYVTKGQFIGEFKVEDIREGKIVLDYKGQKYELYM